MVDRKGGKPSQGILMTPLIVMQPCKAPDITGCHQSTSSKRRGGKLLTNLYKTTLIDDSLHISGQRKRCELSGTLRDTVIPIIPKQA